MHTLNICTPIDLHLLFDGAWENMRERERKKKSLAVINKEVMRALERKRKRKNDVNIYV